MQSAHLAGEVDERASAVAGVDRGVGLDVVRVRASQAQLLRLHARPPTAVNARVLESQRCLTKADSRQSAAGSGVVMLWATTRTAPHARA